jgi:aconitate hydratase
MKIISDPLNTFSTLVIRDKKYSFFALDKLAGMTLPQLEKLPFVVRLLMENMLVHCDGKKVNKEDVFNLAGWEPEEKDRPLVKFIPGRVIMQDFTGIPVLNDLAALRSTLARRGVDPSTAEPLIPVDIVVDHSIQVDFTGIPDALQRNQELEMERNGERYQFLKWAQQAFKQVRVIPPGSGIIHQVNLETLGRVVITSLCQDGELLQAETLVGTDSHTTMINGLGVMGWGVGGIEALAAMLGQPLEFPAPDVLNLELTGKLPEGVTPTDLTLTIVQLLRKTGVVNAFIEVTGSGSKQVSLADRAMIANMTPETGATMIFFPVDEITLDYLRLTGRGDEQIAKVAAYLKAQHLFLNPDAPQPVYTRKLSMNLATIEPSLAGPKRPQDRIILSRVKENFKNSLARSKSEGGFDISERERTEKVSIELNGNRVEIGYGTLALAAITSCTNTSNPSVLVAAGLLAKNALAHGLTPHPWVKASLSPGSRVVTRYLRQAGLLEPLEMLGFSLAGYGCMTCIGNSGALAPEISAAIKEKKLITASVLSGNRNFEGRVNSLIQANYLASPPLVVAYALAGRIDIDLTREPLGWDPSHTPVYLKDLWPTNKQIEEVVAKNIQPELFAMNNQELFAGTPAWKELCGETGTLFSWDKNSTYLQEPPFFEMPASVGDIELARVLAFLGDSITTDHISPAGSIPPASPAGQYLQEQGVEPKDFNSYGSRRANDQVLTRGTLANVRLKNKLAGDKEGGFTAWFPENKQMTIFEAAMRYKQAGIPLVILAGKEYGTGSSRDWAAKGVQQLGVRAVIAESFERIHRSNLAGMGVLPLQFLPGQSALTLQLSGKETFTIRGVNALKKPGEILEVQVEYPTGRVTTFELQARLDSESEINIFHAGGLLPFMLKSFG